MRLMGKEVKVTASEPLTADKGVRIGKTMGKSDEPTLIPIDEDLGGAKKKTVNKASRKISVKSPGGVNKREAEKISDAADALVMDDVKPTKKTTKKSTVSSAKNSKNVKVAGGKTSAKALVMDGMVRQKSSAKAKPVDTKGDLDAKADDLKLEEQALIEEDEDERENKEKSNKKATKQISKPKAAVIAIVVAVLVGVLGMVLMLFLNRPSSAMCVLRFESNGGSKIEEQEVVCGTKASRPNDPEKEGFAFQDWLAEGMPFDFDKDTVDKDMVVTAKWLVDADIEVVRITFDSAGGSEVAEREAVKGKPTTAPLDPTRDGYTFDGWYLDGEEFDFDTPIEEDITLVAGWKASDGTVTRPQAGGDSGDTKKPDLQRLSIAKVASLKVGNNDTYQISVIPVSAEVELEVSNIDNRNVVDCVIAGTGQTLSCMAANPGTAKVTVRDKISGMTAEMTITVTGENGGGSTGGGGGGATPTPPTPPTEEEKCTTNGGTWNNGICETTPPPSDEEKCKNEGGTWDGGVCKKQPDNGGEEQTE